MSRVVIAMISVAIALWFYPILWLWFPTVILPVLIKLHQEEQERLCEKHAKTQDGEQGDDICI